MREPRVLVSLLLRVESLLLLGIALYLIAKALTDTVSERNALTAEIIFLFIGAVGLYFAGESFLKERRLGRGPAVLANLISLGVAYYMIEGGRPALGTLLGALSLATLILAFSAISRGK